MRNCIYGYFTSNSYASPKRRPRRAIAAPTPKLHDLPGPPKPNNAPAQPALGSPRSH